MSQRQLRGVFAPRESLVVSKRVVLQGEGHLGAIRIDQRTNSAGLRLTRSCLLMNLDIDMTGFREAVRVEGSAGVQPLLLSCIVRCAGVSWQACREPCCRPISMLNEAAACR